MIRTVDEQLDYVTGRPPKALLLASLVGMFLVAALGAGIVGAWSKWLGMAAFPVLLGGLEVWMTRFWGRWSARASRDRLAQIASRK